MRFIKSLKKLEEDRGSVVIAMIIVMVTTMALVATLLTVFGGLNRTRTDQNRTNAFQFANAGIDQALFRVDTKSLPTTPAGNYVPIFTNSVLTGFTETLNVSGSTFTITATKDNVPGLGQNQDTFWTVRSTGTDASGRKRLAIASVQATPIFINGFFTLTSFASTGTQTNPTWYRSSLCPGDAPATNPGVQGPTNPCNLSNPVQTNLGTNGSINLNNQNAQAFVDGWQGFDMYGAATLADASARCGPDYCLQFGGTAKVHPIADQLALDPYLPPGAAATGCTVFPPPGKNYIPAGDYHCDSATFSPGDLVTGRLDIKNTDGTAGSARIWVDKVITFTPGTTINYGQAPSHFQLFQKPNSLGPPVTGDPNQSGQFCDQGGAHTSVWGLMYTPGLTIECSGENAGEVYGAILANIYDGTGNQFRFHWDADSSYGLNDGQYHVKNWRECPPASTDC